MAEKHATTPEDILHERLARAYTEHALWDLAAERVEHVLQRSPHLTTSEVLTRLRDAAAEALAEHHRLEALLGQRR